MTDTWYEVYISNEEGTQTIGNFGTYEEAKKLKNLPKDLIIKDIFILTSGEIKTILLELKE
jgi:hypothetical protein